MPELLCDLRQPAQYHVVTYWICDDALIWARLYGPYDSFANGVAAARRWVQVSQERELLYFLKRYVVLVFEGNIIPDVVYEIPWQVTDEP